MAASLGPILSQLERWSRPPLSEQSDAALLERFLQQRDESAFAALVARHGGMVLRSCRRVLGDVHEAEDAFQATFLILARKAHTLRQPAALPGYLHSTARRVALKARRTDRRTTGPADSTALPDPRPDPLTHLSVRELLDILDDEVGRLPAAQRSAVVLCCLEGHSREEAASLLGCPVGSLKGHLERGRHRLQARLRRRGIALAAALALVVASRSEAAPALLLRSTVIVALSGGIGSPAAALAHRVLQTMFLSQFAAAMAVMLTVVLAATVSVVFVLCGPFTPTPEDQTPAIPNAPKDTGASTPPVRKDALGDPLPEGAIARLGTVRLRHGGLIGFTAFTPDGKRLVSKGDDGVRIWDVATGKELRHFAPPPGTNWAAADLSSDGKRIAASIEDRNGRIDLWDVASGKKTASFGQGNYVLIRLSPDGRRLAAYEMADALTRAVELWDVASQRKLRSWKPHGRQQVLSLTFTADSRQLLTGGGEGKVRFWDIENGQQLQEFTRLDRNLGRSPLAFFQNEALSPDGKLLALLEVNEKGKSPAGTVEWKARISLYDVATGKQLHMLTCASQEMRPGYAPAFSGLTFTPGSKKLLTGGPDRFLRVWDAATGDELQRWPIESERLFSLTVSRDGKTLAAVTRKGRSIQILDMANGRPLPSQALHLAQVSWPVLMSDGRRAVTAGNDDKIVLWDVATGRILRVLKGHTDGSLSGLQLSPDGRTLYTVGADKTVRVWDLVSGEEQRRFPLGQDFTPSAFGALALASDGKTLAVLSGTKTVHIFETTSGRELRRWEGPEWIQDSAFAADRSLVVCSGDLKVRIWDAREGRLLREYPLPPELRLGQPLAIGGPSPTAFCAAVSPDGRLLAVGNRWHHRPNVKDFLVFKDLATGCEVHRLDHLPGDLHLLAFSADGRVLAWSGWQDRTIHLLETASGSERHCLPGHASGQIYHLAFSADGTRLISGGSDTTALIWDVRDAVKPYRASAAELQALWADLADKNAARAYQAIRKLAASPASTVPFLGKHLLPVPAVDEKRLTQFITDLDSEDFAARQQAAEELAKLGERAVPAYRRALDGKPSLETRRRLEDLLEKAGQTWWNVSGERLRSLRALEVLELAGTPEARQVLQRLAAGAAGARLTDEAKAALERLARRERK